MQHQSSDFRHGFRDKTVQRPQSDFNKYLHVIMRFSVRNYFYLFLVLTFSMSACAITDNDDTRELAPLPELTCVAVLPTAVPNLNNNGIFSDARKQSLRDGALFLNSALAEDIGGRPEFKLLSEDDLDAILGDPWGGRILQIRDIGQATGCGAVLQTSLSRYKERVGSSMSVTSPASAAFSMELIGVETGVVLWTSSFDESQKALFEDIFSFNKAQKRGFKWLSVEELTRGGLKSRLKDFPYFQNPAEE